MPKDYQTIVDDIMKRLEGSGKKYYSEFYIGITNNIERRLFDEHNVSRENACGYTERLRTQRLPGRWRGIF